MKASATRFLTAIFIVVFPGCAIPAAAQVDYICPGEIPPAGWITIGAKPCTGCCNKKGDIVDMQIIKRIDTLRPGAIERICRGQRIPPGWLMTATAPCTTCCEPGGAADVAPVITKVAGMRSGTVLNICPGQRLPQGWINGGTVFCTGCCGKPREQVPMVTIKKL